MGNKRRRRGRFARRTNRTAMKLITIIVCILFAVLLIQEINLRQRIRYNDETREQLTEQIRDEEKRKESILAQKEYMETDDYIREIARDYLGLVDEDDIILKERNEP